MHELLTPRQMSSADMITIEGGIPGIDLMEAAGSVLLRSVEKHFADGSRVLILCGPGNNGGDGYVVARLLFEAGREVDIFSPLGTDKLSGDAKIACQRLPSDISQIDGPDYSSYGLIIDALFGAGLSTDIDGELGAIVSKVNQSPAAVLAVDLPSGVNGETGAVCGNAIEATATATFFRFKPGHFLYPGKGKCGTSEVGQIGIEESVFTEIEIDTFQNVPPLWLKHFPVPSATQNKYSRGHTLALSGELEKSGAARLMAAAALRTGSGLVTLAGSNSVLPVHASRMDSVMLQVADTPKRLREILADQHVRTICMGPGMNADGTTREFVEQVLKAECNVVLDAGALSAFEGKRDTLSCLIEDHVGDVVITPHWGEFSRLFPELSGFPSKVEMARTCARDLKAVVVLKGPDTVIADVRGHAAITSNAPPWLATAGSGDVLTGMVAGLMAQGMPPFYASCAAVWIHGEAANTIGPGLISSELIDGARSVLGCLYLEQT